MAQKRVMHIKWKVKGIEINELETVVSVIAGIVLAAMIIVLHIEFKKLKTKILRLLERRNAFETVLQGVAVCGDAELSRTASDVFARYQPVSTQF